MPLRRISIEQVVFDKTFSPIEGGFGVLRRFNVLSQVTPDIVTGANFLIKTPKLVHSRSLDERYVGHLDELWEALSDTEVNFLQSRISIPLAIIEDKDSKPLGFAMREFSTGCYFQHRHHDGEFSPSLRAAKVFFNSAQERKIMNVPELTLIDRLLYVHDFWDTLAKLHNRKIIVGDLSGANLILQQHENKRRPRRVIFLDVDSFSFPTQKFKMDFATTIQWRAPEESISSARWKPTFASDVFKGSLFTSRLLHHLKDTGASSYELRRSNVVHDYLESVRATGLSNLLKAGLSTDPALRPEAYRIFDQLDLMAFELNKIIEKRKLKSR